MSAQPPRLVRDWALSSSADYDWVKAREAEYKAEWDPWAPTWFVYFETAPGTNSDGSEYTYYRTGVRYW